MNINIYINVAILGNVNQVLNDLLEKIKCCGLYDSCNLIKLSVNGDTNLLNIDFNDSLNKLVYKQTSKSVDQFEFPCLKQLWNDSHNSDCYILYLHTKGVSRLPDKRIKDWVTYLSYFNIVKWRERISDLEIYDCSGVNLEGDQASLLIDPAEWGFISSQSGNTISPVHYSGNFWWSNSRYIRQLPDPYQWIPDNNYFKWRIMAEMWVCQLNGKFRSAWQSGVNHYREPYPDYMYIDDKHSIMTTKIKREAFQVFIISIRLKRAVIINVQILLHYCKRIFLKYFSLTAIFA